MSNHAQVRLGDTPDGRRIEVSREIAVSQMLAWELLTDTWRWPDWGPTIRDVEASTRFIADGLHGRVNVFGAAWVPYEITSCDGRRWTWDVAHLPATGHRAESRGEDRCRVVFEVPPVLTPSVPVCKRALDRMEAILLGDRRGL